MMRLLTLCTALLLAAACGKASPDPATPRADAGGGETGNATEMEHGERKPLGKLDAFGAAFEVVQYGDVEAGAEGAFELEFAKAEQRIGTVRGWIGTEDGKGSMKSRWGVEGDRNVHGHVDVPDPIPAGSKLWLELERGGDSVTLSIAYR